MSRDGADGPETIALFVPPMVESQSDDVESKMWFREQNAMPPDQKADMEYFFTFDRNVFIGLEGQQLDTNQLSEFLGQLSTRHTFANFIPRTGDAVRAPEVVAHSLGSSQGCTGSVISEIDIFVDEPLLLDVSCWTNPELFDPATVHDCSTATSLLDGKIIMKDKETDEVEETFFKS